MGYQTPKLAQDVRRLRVDIELAVRNMPRFHRYDSGSELRRRIRSVQSLVVLAWREPDAVVHWLELLKHEIDMLKEDLQFAQDIRAFQSLGQFQHLYLQAIEAGRQTGGWLNKQKRPSAQNARAPAGGTQRGQTLSTHAAPAGVNP